jgi:hypothetical protein
MRPALNDRNSSMITALRVATIVLAVGLAAAYRSADGFELITAAEAQLEARAEAQAAPEISPRLAPGPKGSVPSIRVVSPRPGSGSLTQPLRIVLAFRAAPGTHIVPSTFRVLYGLLKIDLTARLRKNATVTESGVVVEGAKVPAGQHRLILQVGDDRGNVGEQELRIKVGEAS